MGYLYSINFLYPKPTIEPENSQLLNNFGISLLYEINQDLSIGMCFRKENFFLRYHGFDKFGLGTTFELQPNFETISGIVKYNFIEFQDIHTNIQISLGANDVGFVNRQSIGATWLFSPNYYLTIDLEHSNMIYNTEKTYFYSNKYGLSFGFYFNFGNN
jgi:hypothetical protein